MPFMMTRIPSGRPQAGEFAAYAQADIDFVEGEDAVAALAAQLATTLALFSPVGEELASSFVYAPGKWTLKQVVGHLSDDERIFAYRVLCIARNDSRPLPGFDEKDYVRFAGFEGRAWADLLAEYRVVRESTLVLFRTFTPEVWLRRGNVNGYDASVRGLAFHIAGHELHHLRIVREKYLRLS
jgi:DinB superfamily